MKNSTPSSRLQEALREYQLRQLRTRHPEGTFDKAQRWYPSEAEHQSCCEAIRGPSRAWPNSLNKHCRSIEHVANLYNVAAKELRKLARAAAKEEKLQSEQLTPSLA